MSDQEKVVFTQEDIAQNKTMGIIAYFIFFIPLLVEPAKNSPYAKFHANQGLLIVLVYIASSVVAIIPILGWIASPILWIAGIVLFFIGLIGAINGEAKELPIVGQYKLIK